jgi:proton-dependent oligopeptide transporter, POT family
MGNYRDSEDENIAEDDRLRPDVREPLNSWRCPSFSQLIVQVCQGFQSLKGSPSELYKAYALKFLDSYSYFSFSIVFTLFLSQDFGFSDVQAGALYGLWGALVTLYGLLVGTLVDNMGVSRSLQLGFALSLLARVCIVFTTSKTMLLLHLCGTLPMGNCLGIPVLTTGIRRYTNDNARGFAFGLFYVIMNVAALLSGPVVDVLTIRYKEAGEEQEQAVNEDGSSQHVWRLTSYRAIILTGIFANFIACGITFTMREIKVEVPNAVPNSTGRVAAFSPRGGTFRQILSETFASSSFRRFLLVCLITLNVRMIFRHLDATLPKYMMREFGDDVPKGTIYSINPALIIILVPLVSAATTTVDPLVMIHIGSYVSAASVFALAVSTSISACIVFVTILSVGEALWSPRLYDYAMSICPEGREGTYMALSNAPLFLAKLPVGLLSGILLQTYCPSEGERHSKTMWLIIGLMTASSPVLMTVCWKYISYRESKDPICYTQLTQPSANII